MALLEKVGLEVPQTTRLLYELKKSGLDLPDGWVGSAECTEALLALWKEKGNGNFKA